VANPGLRYRGFRIQLMLFDQPQERGGLSSPKTGGFDYF